PARVSIASYGSNDEVIRVESAAESFIATNEPALAGWRLERDGEAWPLLRVNGIFLGWRVPAGGGTFTLRYRPPGVAAGVALSLIGLLGLVTLLARWRPREEAADAAQGNGNRDATI
ncbi:MAG: YfhO family protein, partial [Thermoanaerobaculia bacterium]